MLSVVLVDPRNPLNIGAAARAMSNFGFTGLRLVNPYDLSFREAKSAVGAGPVMEAAQSYSTVAEAVADASLVVGTTTGANRESHLPLRRLEQAAKLIKRHRGDIALLFGSEKHGLSNDDLSHCHWLTHIPSRPEHRSINLGQAVAVCLYELIRDPKAATASPPAKPLATVQQSETMRGLLDEMLRLSGDYDHTALAGSERRLRALLKRMSLSEKDAVIWLGIYRQVLWKLRRAQD